MNRSHIARMGLVVLVLVLAGATFAEAPARPLAGSPSLGSTADGPPTLVSAELFEAYDFWGDGEGCEACFACEGILAPWGMSLAGFLVACQGQPAFGCLTSYYGVVISIADANQCDMCRGGCDLPLVA